MSVDGIQKNEAHTILLNRSFKVTVCDANPTIVDNVNQVQKDNELSRQNNMALSQLEEDPTPILNCVAPQDGVESDGACLSIKKLKRNSKTKPQFEVSAEDEPEVENSESSMSEIIPESNSDSTDEGSLIIGEEPPRDALNNFDEAPPLDNPPSDQIPNDLQVVPMDVDEEMESNSSNSIDSDEIEYSAGDNVCPLSVSPKINLQEYSQLEWKGTTHAAEQIRLGYTQVTGNTGCRFMRKIRGDNYCGLRAVAFQILSQNLSVLKSAKDLDSIVSFPMTLIDDYDCAWLSQWSFAGRLSVRPKKRIETLCQCLQTLCEQLKVSRSYTDTSSRTRYFLTLFNSGNEEEIMIFEALKFLMLFSAVMLHNDDQSQGPEFSWLLFARDSSETPEQLMENHFNTVGDTGGLEQVEMCLLGYALNVTIRVIRPSKVHQEDFVTHYPNDHIEDWDKCDLIAEDDRHYNIIVK